MAEPFAQLDLPSPPDSNESEQDREHRLHGVLLRLIEEAADDVGRKQCCYALHLSEQLLSKQLREVDGNRASYRLLAYLVKHQRSAHLARWLVSDYAGYMPPQRPEVISPEEFTRQIAAMAIGGSFGRAEREEVLRLYGRTKGGVR